MEAEALVLVHQVVVVLVVVAAVVAADLVNENLIAILDQIDLVSNLLINAKVVVPIIGVKSMIFLNNHWKMKKWSMAKNRLKMKSQQLKMAKMLRKLVVVKEVNNRLEKLNRKMTNLNSKHWMNINEKWKRNECIHNSILENQVKEKINQNGKKPTYLRKNQ